MSRPLFAIAATAALFAMSGLAQAQSPTVVEISPRYLSAGTTVSSYEYRGEVPYADARFRSATYSLGGRQSDFNEDPWSVPNANQSHKIDFGTIFTRGSRRNF